jgi:hypothetical protein
VKSRRSASRATDPDNCAVAQRVSIKARICLRPLEQYACAIFRAVKR